MDYSLYYEKYFPFWNELSEADKQYLCENSSLEHFEKGSRFMTIGVVQDFIL